MVMRAAQLDRVFGALSDPTRRGILEQLSRGETNVSTLAEPYDISQPAVSKHLRVLENAGLIRRTKHGREQHVRVETAPINDARNWIARYEPFWRRHFDAVDQYLKKQEKTNR